MHTNTTAAAIFDSVPSVIWQTKTPGTKELNKIFKDEGKRKAFRVWAAQHPDIIKESSRLRICLDRVRELDSEADFESACHEDIVSSQAFAVGQAISNLGAFFQSVFKGRKETKETTEPLSSFDRLLVDSQGDKSLQGQEPANFKQVLEVLDCLSGGLIDESHAFLAIDQINRETLMRPSCKYLTELFDRQTIPLRFRVYLLNELVRPDEILGALKDLAIERDRTVEDVKRFNGGKVSSFDLKIISDYFQAGLITKDQMIDLVENIELERVLDDDKISSLFTTIDPNLSEAILKRALSLDLITSSIDILKFSTIIPSITPDKSLPILREMATKLLRLQQGNEDYLRIPSHEYEAVVKTLKELIEPLGNAELSALIEANATQEQRLLLQYVTPAEMVQIRTANANPLLVKVSAMLNEGKWMEVLQKYSAMKNQLSYILIAAYLRKKITIDTLSTALTIHRAYLDKPDSLSLLPFNPETLGQFSIPDERLTGYQEILEIGEVEANQLLVIKITSEGFDPYTLNLVADAFDPLIPGIFRFEDGGYGVASFGLAKLLYAKKGVSLMNVLHLTPRDAMISRIDTNLSDCGQFLASEKSIIHGSSDCTILPFGHDLFHANIRVAHAENSSLRLNAKNIAYAIQEHLKVSSQTYLDKLSSGQNQPYRTFVAEPTFEELKLYALRRISGLLIDAEYRESQLNRVDMRLLIAQVVANLVIENVSFVDSEKPVHFNADELQGSLEQFLIID